MTKSCNQQMAVWICTPGTLPLDFALKPLPMMTTTYDSNNKHYLWAYCAWPLRCALHFLSNLIVKSRMLLFQFPDEETKAIKIRTLPPLLRGTLGCAARCVGSRGCTHTHPSDHLHFLHVVLNSTGFNILVVLDSS